MYELKSDGDYSLLFACHFLTKYIPRSFWEVLTVLDASGEEEASDYDCTIHVRDRRRKHEMRATIIHIPYTLCT